MATVFVFPSELADRAGDHLQSSANDPKLAGSGLADIRRSIRQSLLMLDISVFQLRRSMPAHLSERFYQEIAAIDALLAAARREAQKI